MSKMITARVPDALYEQGSSLLSDLGSNTSELVNAAFEYVVEHKKLPTAGQKKESPKSHKLNASQRQSLVSVLSASTLHLPFQTDIEDDKKVLHEIRAEKDIK